MNASAPGSGRLFYDLAETAWLLGVPRAVVSRGIRVGEIPAVWRRSRLVVPAYVVKRLLGEAAGGERA
jgi:hypothetical protein